MMFYMITYTNTKWQHTDECEPSSHCCMTNCLAISQLTDKAKNMPTGMDIGETKWIQIPSRSILYYYTECHISTSCNAFDYLHMRRDI